MPIGVEGGISFCVTILVRKEGLLFYQLDFPGGASGKESTCQCRRHKRCWFDP